MLVDAKVLKRRAWQRAWLKGGKGLALNRRRALRRYRAGKLWVSEAVEIMALFGGACAYCGTAVGSGSFDHLVPLARGGLSVPENMVPCCLPCNYRKGARFADPTVPRGDAFDGQPWYSLVKRLEFERLFVD